MEGDLEQRRGAGGVDGGGGPGGGRIVWNGLAVGEGVPRRAERTAGGGGTVEIALWRCSRCLEKTFATRRKCFGCGLPRPNNATWVREKWKRNFLPRDVQELRGEEAQGEEAGEVSGGGVPGGGKGRAEKGGNAGKGEGQTPRQAGLRGAEGPTAGCGQGGGKGNNAKGGKQSGKDNVEGAEPPPGARPKAAAARPGAKGTPTGESSWAVVPPPYAHPDVNRIELVGREQALQQRIQELPSEDPRRAIAEKRIGEVAEEIKRAGGFTGQKLVWSFVDGQKQVRAVAAKIEDAEALLQQKQQAAAKALEDEAKAEVEVEALRAKERNCRQRNAHLAMQVAVEATVGVDGFGELEAHLCFLGSALAGAGLVQAEQSYMAVADFVRKFAPQHYAKELDPVVRELDSAASTITIDLENERVDWIEQEARGEARHVSVGPVPRAFETSIATVEAARLTQAGELQQSLPAVCEIWKASKAPDKSDGERRSRATKTTLSAKRTLGGTRAHSEERLVQNKTCKQAARKRSSSLLRPALQDKKGQVPMDVLVEGKVEGSISGGSGSVRGGKPREKRRGRSRSLSRERSRRRGSVRSQSSRPEGKGHDGPSQKETRGWGKKEEGEARAAAFEHCLGCGAGPLRDALLQARCHCGGPLCEECQGANACMRCNGAC